MPVPHGWPSGLLELRPIKAGPELEAAAALEAASYPADEAASPERLAYRQKNAGRFFWGAFDKRAEDAGRGPGEGALVGFVVGTLAAGTVLTEESMGEHVDDGELLCIHSVVVREDLRRRGVALVIFRSFLQAVAEGAAGGGKAPPPSAALISKAHNISLYLRCGFRLVGLSDVVHGATPWVELRADDLARTAAAEPMLQCDAFASVPCSGNPAAVLFTQREGDERWMQRVANENNLAETAFVERLAVEDSQCGDSEPSHFALRWFTPTVEVDLCGHATLAAAHALWSTGRADRRKSIAFKTLRSGVLTCKPAGGWIEMDFPADPPAMNGAPPPGGAPAPPAAAELASALGVAADSVLTVGRGKFDVLCELTPAAFDAMTPSQTAISSFQCRGLVVTTAGCEGSKDGARAAEAAEKAAKAAAAEGATGSVPKVDFRSRFFGPQCGVPEDPVTGSAHCMLSPYWVGRLDRKPSGEGGAVVVGFQASHRGGIVRCDVRGAADGPGRVVLSGRAVTTLEGTMHCG